MIDKSKHYFYKMRKLNYINTPVFTFTFTSSSDKETWVECEIVEDRYKIDDGYKVTLRALDKFYGEEHFYQMDFEHLLEDGRIIVKTKDNQHVENVTWYEPISHNINMVCNADILVD